MLPTTGYLVESFQTPTVVLHSQFLPHSQLVPPSQRLSLCLLKQKTFTRKYEVLHHPPCRKLRPCCCDPRTKAEPG